jgi:hypothetical protein
MIDELRIRNFKAWRDTGDMRLAPLTVIFGANSSGKSSLLQLPLMLRQTVESPDRRRVLHVGDAQTPIDLGSFRSLVWEHDLERRLEFSVGWPLPIPLELVDARSKTTYRTTRLRFDASIEGTAEGPKVIHMQYSAAGDGDDPLTLGLRRTQKRYEVIVEGYDPIRTQGRPALVAAPDHFHGFPDELRGSYQNLDITADLSLTLEERLRSISYLGPLREPPVRWYRWSGEVPDWVGSRGERAVEMLLADRGARYSSKPREHRKTLQALTASWLVRLGIVKDFAVEPIVEGRDEYEVRVRITRGAPSVLLTDVGFGVSQVLPVVTGVLGAARDTTLLFEQPEIHLHPAAQAELADLFITGLDVLLLGKRRNVQFVVETHSEHLLRRLMRRQAEGRIPPRTVAIYYVESGAKGSELRELELDEFGDIRNWPTNFFGDSIGDIAAQARAARDRRRNLRGG